MRPDLPTPATITRPSDDADEPTARANSSPSRCSSAAKRLVLETNDATPALDDLVVVHAGHLVARTRARVHVAAPGGLPLAARLEEILDELADGASPAVARQLVRGRRRALRAPRCPPPPAARRCAGAACPGKSSPTNAACSGATPCRFENPHEPGELVAVGILRDVVDAELAARSRTLSETRPVTIATGMSHQAQHRDAETVLDLVALELEPPAVDVAEVDAAVGHDAVDVERDELDGLRERRVDHRDTRSQMSMARSTSSSSWSSGIMFGPSLGALSGSGCVSMNSPSAPAATRRERERRNELARAAARAAGALPWTLHAVRRVEDHRARRTRRACARSRACRRRDRRSRRTMPRSVTATSSLDRGCGRRPRRAHLVDGAAHSLGMHPLPLLHVHGLARRAGGDEQIGLAAEKRRDLQHVDDLRRRRALLRADGRR